MIEAFFLAYGALLVAGSWLMLTSVADAPLGYEDADGFHYGQAPVRSRVEGEARGAANGCPQLAEAAAE